MPALREIEEYRQFTTPAELHKAINTLRGIVAGITTDMHASQSEVEELINWCTLHSHLRNKNPFNELLPVIESVYADGIVTDEEAADILWLCNNFIDDAGYYDVITSSIQFLSGLLHGIMADGIITDQEIKSLSRWVDANRFLQGCYPFDEIESLLISVLSDGVIDESERDTLKAFFSNFIDITMSYNLSDKELSSLREKYSVSGICAVDPVIDFIGKEFCFTGKSERGTRADIQEIVEARNGIFRDSVNNTTDYLVVGSGGNPCWAYACYGRKIEKAVQFRKAGKRLIIVHENDFWDAVC
jgi:hypothetical protein